MLFNQIAPPAMTSRPMNLDNHGNMFFVTNCFDIYSHFVKLDWLFSPSHFVIVIFRSVWICDNWQIATKPWLLLMDLLFSLCKKNFELLPPLNFNRKRFKYFRKFNFLILVINFVCWHFANIDILCSNTILGSFHLLCPNLQI